MAETYKEALLFDVRHSDSVLKFLYGRKQLYPKESCLFQLTLNKTKGHQTPFWAAFPKMSDEFTTNYPDMAENQNSPMYYLPSQATESLYMIDPPNRLSWQAYTQSAEYKLLLQATTEISDYVKWRQDRFVNYKPFTFECSDVTAKLCKYFFKHSHFSLN